MGMLDRVHGPADLRGLSEVELTGLADEIRRFLVQRVSATGGHLGPNLGVVELTLALHRVFDSPHDPIIFDVGHQAYVHKILTGRRDGFDRLRKRGGLSGYPSRAESGHDWAESSHASAALSYADGMAKAFAVSGDEDRTVAAVVGDGALTGGMCWEALNNIAGGADRPLVIVVNDNGRSYSPTIGGLARLLTGLRLQPGYERALDSGRRLVQGMPLVGDTAYKILHGVKTGVKDAVSPQELFTDLGLKYLGPVDGHDVSAMESALRLAKDFGGPVIVHAVTRKGMGYPPAENDEVDQMHSVKVIDPETGAARSAPKPDWTSVFSQRLVERAAEREDLVAITAAMAGPTGLAAFGERFPERFFDVGIAEQHALASAAGMALAGLHPVVALYSTFLNRAFDQLLMDVALLDRPVTLVLDRAGITGTDGPSHNGMWDLSLLGVVPGIRVAAPRDGARLREEFDEALAVDDGPTVVRFPKGALPESCEAVRRVGDADVLGCTAGDPPGRAPGGGTGAAGAADVLILAIGPFAGLAMRAAEGLRAHGVTATVVDPRWVLPVGEEIIALAQEHAMVVTVEDGGVHGGVGSAVSGALRSRGVDVPCRDAGIPQRFIEHAAREEVHEDAGLTEDALVRGIMAGWMAQSRGPRAAGRPADAGRMAAG